MRLFYLAVLVLVGTGTVFTQAQPSGTIISTVNSVSGGCSNVDVSFSSTNVVVSLSTNQSGPASNCQVVSYDYFSAYPKVWLEKKQSNGSYTTVQGGSSGISKVGSSYSFTGVSSGTYRVRSQTAAALTNNNGFNCAGGIAVYNSLGSFLGIRGAYGQSNSVTGFSAPVIVGKTDLSDIQLAFIDYPVNDGDNLYEYGEQVTLDLSASKDFNRYRIAVTESGPSKNRWKTNNWTSGSPSTFDLTRFWSGSGYNDGFLINHSYEVQVVLENQNCLNSSWNQKFVSFFICSPAPGQNCRINFEAPAITIAPNPTSDFIQYFNLNTSQYSKLRTRIFNASGSLVLEEALNGSVSDVSGLTSGIYFVQVMDGGDTPVYSGRFVRQ